MKFILRSILSVCFISLIATNSLNAQGFLKAKETMIVNEKGEKVILRGMGLGGWMLQEGYMLRVQKIGQQQHVIKAKMEELVGKEKTTLFYDAWLDNHTRKIDIDSLAAWGFNSVRLPMHYNLYTLPVEQEPIAGQNTWLEKGFALTDSLLKWCKTNKMYLILDLHATPGGQGHDLNISDRDAAKPSLWESEANQQKTIALWKKLAERYANEPWIGGYDLINEPNWGFEPNTPKNGCSEQKNEPLKKLMVSITEAIREVDKNHIVIIEGNCWGNNYKGILPTWDNNMVLSFHKYWSYNDEKTIHQILDFRSQYNVPVWLGESGENSNQWFRDAINLVETNDIGWAWWPLRKLGYNNPLEVKTPDGYAKILDFWAEKGPKPSADEAYSGLMELANNVKLENCVYHKDVIDAMFRQVRSAETKPFVKNEIRSNAKINAVDFDLGRNRFAYYDLDSGNYYISAGGKRTPGNRGNVYRNDCVDIEAAKDLSQGQYYVNHFETGEWLQYTVNVKSKGTYTLKLMVAADSASGRIDLLINSQPIKKDIAVPATGGVEKWQTIDVNNISFQKGKNIIRVKAQQGGFDFMSMQFVLPKK